MENGLLDQESQVIQQQLGILLGWHQDNTRSIAWLLEQRNDHRTKGAVDSFEIDRIISFIKSLG